MPTKAELIAAGQAYYAAQDHLMQGVVRPIFHRNGNELAIYRDLSRRFLIGTSAFGGTTFPQYDNHAPQEFQAIDTAYTAEIEAFVEGELRPLFNQVASGAFAEERGLFLPRRDQAASETMPLPMRTKANLEAIRDATAELRSLSDEWERDFDAHVAALKQATAGTIMPFAVYEDVRTQLDGRAHHMRGAELMERFYEAFPRLAPRIAA